MLTFTVRRLLYGIVLLFVIVTLAYLLLYAAAGNVGLQTPVVRKPPGRVVCRC